MKKLEIDFPVGEKEIEELSEFIEMNIYNKLLFNSYDVKDIEIIDLIQDKKYFLIIANPELFLKDFKNVDIRKKVLQNFYISRELQKHRSLLEEPCTGDIFIDDESYKYRLVSVGENKFQFTDDNLFCSEGSFFMGSKGTGSMSGSFKHDVKYKGKEISIIYKHQLNNTGEKEKRDFWFFMDNLAGANRKICFKSEVNVYKSI